MKLERDFYMRDGLTVARELIGKKLVHRSPEGLAAGIIVETEAYIGPEDAGSHAYKARRTKRTAIQYGPGGYAYVYRIYGLHSCMNVVAAPEERPEAILIRALEPVEGLELMMRRRGTEEVAKLCRGPGNLCQALGIGMEHYGMDLCGDELYIETVEGPEAGVCTDKRINIDYAGEAADYPWRFLLRGSRYISAPPKGWKIFR